MPQNPSLRQSFFYPVTYLRLRAGLRYVARFGVKKKRHRTIRKPAAGKRAGSGKALSVRKKRVFLALFSLLSVFATLAAIEGGARLFEFGYPAQFFWKRQVAGRPVLTINHRFFWSFFPKALSRSPQPIQWVSQKPEGTKRVLIFGESAAMGDPEPAFGLARLLEWMLERRHPDSDWEVINLAVTAINSHVIVPMAREAAQHEADFWCLYLGNNEVHGQFGPGTVFGSRRSNLRWIRASLAVKRTRLGQMANALVESAARSANAAEWGGMAMFVKHQVPADDPRLNGVYENFEANLGDIIAAGLQSGAKVLISSVAVNLRGSSPFRSALPESVTGELLAEWSRLFGEARQLFEAGLYQDALATAYSAAKIHAGHAELAFLIGRCCWHLGDDAGAKAGFLRARDLDTLRFRADSKLNAIIQRTATTYPSKDALFVDAEALFAYNAPRGIPGDELFWDHVHFRFPGNYLLALAFAREIESQLPGGRSETDLPPWPSLSNCAQALTLTRWSDLSMTQSMRRRLNKEPFRSQSIHAERNRRLAQELQEHAVGAAADAFPIQQGSFERALEKKPRDFVLRDLYGKYLLSFKKQEEAVAQWQKVVEQIPHHLMAHFQIGQALAEDPNRAAEAEASLRRALQIRPATANILAALGKSLSAQGKYEEALKPLREALRLRPTSIGVLLQSARTQNALRQREQARRHLEKAAALAPDDPSVAAALAELRPNL